ncbi:ComEC family competence protein [Roseovarius gaetbuli]|uniref:ComEC family competence protein n=1 Tax=Roseovarius gaetbuli TaxID=1356575 RepID=A0A1X6YD03_9RHOB|nr:ComEC/Rec2 family competence protein [Roseovarius gaetbuli]SLN17681.1 ComEC family competence protein [Roseovarius gaetbuli]
MSGVWQVIERNWLIQRGALFGWVPVALACGIGGYFALRTEPSMALLFGLAGVAVCLAVLGWRGTAWTGPLAIAAALVLAGFCLAGLRAHLVAGPVLGWRYYGPVEGRVVAIDRSASDALRLTLDQVVLSRTAPNRVPSRVRVSLHGDQEHFSVKPGQRVMMTAHLSPPSGPVEPGGFDFQRHAWFKQIGAVGYTRAPVLAIAPATGAQWLFRARMALSVHVQARLAGQVGAFAAAIMTGDRSGLDQDTLVAMRVSNLAHLLAISGLHMGLLAGFVFAAFRLGFAALPTLGLRVPGKKISAVMALAAAAAYLGLSGGNVATERAFVMVAVMLIAVMLDRRALSLRAVAVAAIIVLCLRPEALMGPGFQMSFAATVALVAVFGWLRDAQITLGPGWLRPILTVVISSAVAGAATAPVGAAHFNQFAQYGLIANLASVPLMGLLVMPAAVLAACLLPLGLDWIALWVMGLGLRWILAVSAWVASLDGARALVPAPGPEVLPVLAVGALLIVLWQGRLRFVGVIPMCLAAWAWIGAERPVMLISDSGSLVGVMTDQGRALNKGRGGGFVAQNWLENDGDAAEQEAAFARWPGDIQDQLAVKLIQGKAAARRPLDCGGAKLLVMTADPESTVPAGLGCDIISPATLRSTGSLALYESEKGLRIVGARDITGVRLWNGAPRRQ